MKTQKESINDDIVSEEPEYSAKSEFSKPKLVENAFAKCVELRSKEMHSGYENTSKSSDGTIFRQRFEDSRQAYCNSVRMLRCLLAPEIKRNQQAKKDVSNLFKKEKELWKKYAYTEPLEPDKPNRKITFSDKIFMPENDEILKTTNYMVDKQKLAQVKGCWNHYVNAYWNGLVKLRDLLFQKLSVLVDSENYFKGESSF